MTRWTYLWNRIRNKEIRQVIAKGEGVGGGMKWEGRVSRCKLLHVEWINNKVLLHTEVTQSCPTLCDPVDCSPPGSSIHGILQARILECVAISFSRGSSQPRDRTQVSCIAGRCFNLWATREAPLYSIENYIQYPMISHSGKEYLKNNVYIYIYTHTHMYV